jgi:hypothetical protein
LTRRDAIVGRGDRRMCDQDGTLVVGGEVF